MATSEFNIGYGQKTQSFTPTKYITSITARRHGDTVTLIFYDLKNLNEMSQGAAVDVYTLPEEFRPMGEIRQTFVLAESTARVYRISVYPDGKIQMWIYFTTTSSAAVNNHTSMTYPK